VKTSTFGAAMAAALLVSSSLFAAEESVAARVNGVVITSDQVDDLSMRMTARGGPHHPPLAPDTARQNALDTLIDIEVLAQAAEAENVRAAQADVDKQLSELKGQFPTAEAFQEALRANDTSEEELKKDIAQGLAVQALIDRHVSVKLEPKAAEEFYKSHSDKFQHPAEVRASHILFRSAEGDSAEARKRAEETLARVKKGDDFGKLAKQLSEDPGSAQRNGDLGFFSREKMVKPFADAAFNLKPGQVSEPVETPFGVHLIKVTDSRDAGQTPLADVKPQIEAFLEQQQRQAQERAYVDQLKKNAKIEIVERKAE
jgi:peptidyl-prolyl cis-trans isomerase C